MATLTTPGTWLPVAPISKKVAVWAIDDVRNLLLIPTDGFYAGVVAENYPAPMPNALVRIHYQPTGHLIAQAFSKDDGTFHFEGLEPGKSWYTVIAYHADGGTNYRAKSYDQVVAGT